MAQSTSQYGVKISGDSIESLQFTIQNIDDILISQPLLATAFFYQENQLTQYFYFSQFLESDIVREMQKAIKIIAIDHPITDLSDLDTMESLLSYSQANHWLPQLFSKLHTALRKGHLSKATSGQIAKQRKSFLQALATSNSVEPRQPLMGRHNINIHSNFDLHPTYLAIADVPASLHSGVHSSTLELELGAIETRINHIFGLTIELDIDLFDQHRTLYTSRHMIQNPQFNHASGVVFVPIRTHTDAIITLQHFYAEGKQRSLMDDEQDFRQRTKEKQKPQRHSYLCSIIKEIPTEDRLALVFSGASIYDMHFYSQLIEIYIHRLTSLSVTIIARTVNVPIEKQNMKETSNLHHHHAIYHAVYASTAADVTLIQVALGFGKRSVQRPLIDQPKLHFLDLDQTIAVLVSKDYTSLHNKQYADSHFTRIGFEIAHLDMLFFPYLEQALTTSTTYRQWQVNPNILAIFGVPTFAAKSRGAMMEGTLSLRFICARYYEPLASHALDDGIRQLAPSGCQPLYYGITLDLYNNLPPYFRPQLQLVGNQGYKADPVPLFKSTDVQSAKLTHSTAPPVLQQLFTPTRTTARAPTQFAEQFLAAQQTPHGITPQQTLNSPIGTAINSSQPLNVNPYSQLYPDSDEDHPTHLTPSTQVTPTVAPPMITVSNPFPSYLSQTSIATGADLQSCSQRSSALVYTEMSPGTRARQDVAATDAVNSVNINTELRDVYEAVIYEEAAINDIQQALVSRMLPSAQRGKLEVVDRQEIQQLHVQLSSKKACYIRSLIVVPATVATSNEREGIAIQLRQTEIDHLLTRTDLQPNDYLDIIYKYHQTQWRQSSLQRAAKQEFDTVAPSGIFPLSEQSTDVVKEMALIREESAQRSGVPNPVDLLTPGVTHGLLVEAITDLQRQLTNATGQPVASIKKQYRETVKTLKLLRHEHIQLAHLAELICSPFTGLTFLSDTVSNTTTYVTRLSMQPSASNGPSVPMQVDVISELAKRKLPTHHTDQK